MAAAGLPDARGCHPGPLPPANTLASGNPRLMPGSEMPPNTLGCRGQGGPTWPWHQNGTRPTPVSKAQKIQATLCWDFTNFISRLFMSFFCFFFWTMLVTCPCWEAPWCVNQKYINPTWPPARAPQSLSCHRADSVDPPP